MPADVFISHSSLDKQMADAVCAFLESKGVSCWIAPRNILPGEEWGDSILRGIQNCKIMVLIFSKVANDSGPVRSEVDRAVNGRKILIPFRIENVPPTGAMEFHIGRRHWLDAYNGPLEGHFELLARAVRDGLKPAEAIARDTIPLDSTISPTLAKRADATTLRPPPQDDLPLGILLNFGHVVVAGHPSTFQMQAENKGKVPLERIEIVMESRGLERPTSRTLARLAPGQTQRHFFEIEPIRSGNFVLQCTIKCQEESKQLAFVGSRPLRINEAPGTANIVINMNELKGNSGDSSATAGSGSQLGNLVAAGSVKTLNDLLNLELPAHFEPLELALDYEVSMGALALEEAAGQHRLLIPGMFLTQAQAGAVLKLEPVGTAPNTRPEVRLVARPDFSLGRSREEADFLTWFWPRNELNDQKTRRISKKHCLMSIKGSKLSLRDNETSNRSMFDGQAIAPDGDTLERRGILSLAGTYFLDVTPFSSNTTQGPSITNLRNWSGAKTPTTPAVSGSVRFLPMSKAVVPQNSTWLLTDGAFGTSRANPIIIEIKGLAEIQGRFHHHLGGFWLENSVANGAVSVNGAKLDPGFIVPMVSGQQVKLGDSAFRVTVLG